MKRFFKSPKWIVLSLLGLAVLLLAIAAAWVALVQGGLGGRIAALRAAGQPVCLGDLAPRPIDAKDNAVTYLLLAKRDVEAVDGNVNSAEEKVSRAEQELFENGTPGPEMVAVIRAEWETHPDLFVRLEQAANCSGYNSGRDYSVDAGTFSAQSLGESQYRRSLARALSYRTRLQVADGQLDDALHTCAISLRLIRKHDGQFFIDRLIDYACFGVAFFDARHALAAGPISPAARAELENELAQLDLEERFRTMLPAERAYGLQFYLEGGDRIGPIFLMHLVSWLKNEQANYFEGFVQAIAATKLPTWEWKDHVHPEEEGSVFLPDPLFIADQAHTAMLRTLAQLRAIRVLNAIQRRQQADELAEPIDLAKLGLPAETTIDPFDGQPLRLKKLPTGWAVYSIGQNLTDDGGIEMESPAEGDVGAGLEPPTPTGGAAASGEETAPEE
jgi:hypothetical protein